MDLMQLLWLFFIVSALQPALQRKYLEAMRTRKIAQIERMRGSRVILMIHRQETMNLLGFPWFATSTLTTPRKSCARSS